MQVEQAVDVLVIEDRTHLRELVLDALPEISGIRAKSIAPGDVTLKFLAECTILPKVVLLDSHLCGIDPFELLRRIRSTERTKSLPVFLMADSKDRQMETSTPYVMVNGLIPRTADRQILAARLTILQHLCG